MRRRSRRRRSGTTEPAGAGAGPSPSVGTGRGGPVPSSAAIYGGAGARKPVGEILVARIPERCLAPAGQAYGHLGAARIEQGLAHAAALDGGEQIAVPAFPAFPAFLANNRSGAGQSLP